MHFFGTYEKKTAAKCHISIFPAGETRFFPQVTIAQLFSFRKYPKVHQSISQSPLHFVFGNLGRRGRDAVTRHCTDSHYKSISSSSRVHETRASLRINQFHLSIMLARTIPPAHADNPHHCVTSAQSHYTWQKIGLRVAGTPQAWEKETFVSKGT